MAKKTYLDRFKQLLQMSRGEDVIEDYNSEKTAKAEYHKMLEVDDDVNHNVGCSVFLDTSGRYSKEDINYYWQFFEKRTGLPVDEGLPIWIEIIKSGMMKKKRFGDCFSVKDKQIHNDTDVKPHYGYRHGYESSGFGKYVANCVAKTNTSKQRTISDYSKVATELLQKLRLCNIEYTPLSSFRNSSTEYGIRSRIAKAEEILNSPIPPCSDKQAFWVAKRLGIDETTARNLNKYQASELLDVLFNGEENRWAVDPDATIAHYKKIFGLNESLVRLSQDGFDRIIRESIRKTLKKLL